MKTETLKSIETASIDDLKKIIGSLRNNKDVKALDINLSIDVIERINEELYEELFEYLFGIDDGEIEKISEKLFKTIDSKGLDFYEPYFNDLENYNKINRWEFSYSSEYPFIYWVEMDINKFFKDNLTEDIIKSK